MGRRIKICQLILGLLIILQLACSKCLGANLRVTNSHGQQGTTNQLTRWITKIDDAVNKLQDCVKFPGLSLSIVKVDSNAETLIRSYGVLDVDSKREVDENTRFCIGSVTKGFTAVLLTHLLQQNETYHLDSLVKDILGPDFELISNDLTTKTTVRDILAHRVGIAKHFGAFLLGYNFTRAQLLRRIRYLPQVKPFRSSRLLNNFLYVVAGALVEKIGKNAGGSSNKANWWENQMTEYFLKPLKMEGTTFADRVADWTGNFAIPHALLQGELKTLRAKVTGNILRPIGPAGSMCTTAKDMGEWLKLLLKSRSDVVNDTVVDQLFTISNHFSNKTAGISDNLQVDSASEGYGLGWVIGNYRGLKRVFHSGFSNYYYSMISLLPEKGIGIYTSVNGPHLIACDNGIKALHYYLTDILLATKPWLNVSNICSYPRHLLQKTSTTPIITTTTTQAMPSTESTTFETILATTDTGTQTKPLRSRKARRRQRLGRSVVTSKSQLSKYEGSYDHPFFGPISISFNRSVEQLQLNYGYYGKALLQPINRQVFQMNFFGSIWYQSESDDMKLFADKNVFNIQFGNFSRRRGGAPNKLVVFMFDTESPPIFTRAN